MVEKRVILDIHEILQQIAIDCCKTSDFLAAERLDICTEPLSSRIDNVPVPGGKEKMSYNG
ncbi:MAG: hypothetical protein K0R28_87 [Paenibacillus sp.]|jgi:hypothetical protein|nr:hypothetical protein [Paenibacillus sp.]